MKKIIIVLYLASISWVAGAQHSHSAMHKSEMDSKTIDNKTVTAFITVGSSQNTASIIDNYLKIKDALADDNSNNTAKFAELLFKDIGNFNVSKQKESQQKELNEILNDAGEQAEHIAKNSGKISHQREHFENLSTDIKDLIIITGLNRDLYQIFCPMYNNGEGAMWLSASKTINNPYLGSKMMACGSVQQKITIK